MPIRIKDVEIPVSDQPADDQVGAKVCEILGLKPHELKGFSIQKKSLDARRKARIVYHYQVDAFVEDEDTFQNIDSTRFEKVASAKNHDPLQGLSFKDRKTFNHKPIIVGSGPSGIFAALTLALIGEPSIIIERGEPVEQRIRTTNKLRSRGIFSAKSNYCFGEGGAGAFSDGKLTCGRNHPLIQHVFEQFVRFGAPAEILFDAKPHIGTDFLVRIAKRMRVYLESLGCEFLFNTELVDFQRSTTSSSNEYNVTCSTGIQLTTDRLILAVGHSARDTYEMLLKNGLSLVPKPFAMGARIEHPQDLVNRIQFGSCKLLPAAEYKLAAQAGDRGIWTFCMCPGGHLMPTNAQEGHLAINGMSYHKRSSGYANAAVVVNVLREDFYRGHPLDGMHFQAALERASFQMGGGNYHSPAQRLPDFIGGRDSKGDLKSTYKPGVSNGRLDKLLPSFIVDALREGIKDYDKKMRGYISKESLIVGIESKTSSPISMMRGKDFQSVSHPGIYPIGEGAGFAGGIVSAALDGVRVGRAILEEIASKVESASI